MLAQRAASVHRAVDEAFLGPRFSVIFLSVRYLDASVVLSTVWIAVLAAGVTLGGMILHNW